MRRGCQTRDVSWRFTAIACAVTIAVVGFLPGTSAQEVLSYAFSGYTDTGGLLISVSIEIVLTFGYALLRLESYGGRSHRGLRELQRIRTGSDQAYVRGIATREAVGALVYVSMIVASAAIVLLSRFASELTPDEVSPIAGSLTFLAAIGAAQVFLYVFVSTGVVLEHASMRVAIGVLVLAIVVPPVGIRPDWLPIHQFTVPTEDGHPAIRLGATVAASVIATAIASASRPLTGTDRISKGRP